MKILDTTLRDGSYEINFNFSSQDTTRIALGLEHAGIELIEIGHGIGLGASAAGHGIAKETDESYMASVAGMLKTAKWGMFCIPEIAKLEHLDIAASFNMDFIRIGIAISNISAAKPFIEKAKQCNMLVAVNFMKSYAKAPKDFAIAAKTAQLFGADVAYLVDSAGSMLPMDIKDYIEVTRDTCDIPLAFHGHNNLSLACANSLLAYDMGVDIIDTSLQGMGRSAGNTSTEQFISILLRKGIDTTIDLLSIMDLSRKEIYHRRNSSNIIDDLDVICGLAGFHSSYINAIHTTANKYKIDPRVLIIHVCKENRESAPINLLEQKAKEIKNNYYSYQDCFS